MKRANQHLVLGLLATLGLLVPVRVAAQARDIAFVTINFGGLGPATSSFEQNSSQRFGLTTVTARGAYEVKSGGTFDIGGAGMITPEFGIGVAFSHFSSDQKATLTFGINSLIVSKFTTTKELEHSETAVHIQAVYVPRLMGPVKVVVFGGPSHISVKQSLIQDFDVIFGKITGTDQKDVEASAWGFNVGGDVAYYFNLYLGVGGMVRYSTATVDLTNALDETINKQSTTSFKAGGVVAGGGVRFRW